MTDAQKTRIAAVLQECEEYFAARSDEWVAADGSLAQNDENRLRMDVGDALDMLGYGKNL